MLKSEVSVPFFIIKLYLFTHMCRVALHNKNRILKSMK